MMRLCRSLHSASLASIASLALHAISIGRKLSNINAGARNEQKYEKRQMRKMQVLSMRPVFFSMLTITLTNMHLGEMSLRGLQTCKALKLASTKPIEKLRFGRHP